MKKIVLCLTGVLLCLSVYAVKVGDKVVLDANTARYATGERIKENCLGKTYTIQQLGTKKYPNAILLKEISSWVECTHVGVSVQELQDGKQGIDSKNDASASTATASTTTASITTATVSDRAAVRPDTVVKVITDTVTRVVTDTITKEVKETIVKVQSDTIIKVVKDTVLIRDTVQIEASVPRVVTPDSVNSNAKPFNRVSLGLRGGVAAYMADAKPFARNIGYQGMFDVQYAHYFKRKDQHKPYCGILVGVSAGYVSSSICGSINDAYSTTDASGDAIDYTITVAQAKSTMNEVQLQVPLMFSLLYKGLYFNVGPRFVVPVYTMGRQTLTDAHISAFYAPYGVTITDAAITGKLSEDQLDAQVPWDSPKIQINASLEIGYEFALKNGDAFGLGLYADYGVYNTYKANQSAQSMINISQVGADVQNPAPKVDVLPMLSSYATYLGNFDVGIKLVYHFNFK